MSTFQAGHEVITKLAVEVIAGDVLASGVTVTSVSRRPGPDVYLGTDDCAVIRWDHNLEVVVRA